MRVFTRICLPVCLTLLSINVGCSLLQSDAQAFEPMIDAISKADKKAIDTYNFAEATWLISCLDMLKLEQNIVKNGGKLPPDIASFKKERDLVARYNGSLKQYLEPNDYDKLKELRRRYHYNEYVE